MVPAWYPNGTCRCVCFGGPVAPLLPVYFSAFPAPASVFPACQHRRRRHTQPDGGKWWWTVDEWWKNGVERRRDVRAATDAL